MTGVWRIFILKNTFSLLPGLPIPSWKSSCRNSPVWGFIIESMEIVCPLKISPERGSLESLPSGLAPKIRAIPARCLSHLTLTEVPVIDYHQSSQWKIDRWFRLRWNMKMTEVKRLFIEAFRHQDGWLLGVLRIGSSFNEFDVASLLHGLQGQARD